MGRSIMWVNPLCSLTSILSAQAPFISREHITFIVPEYRMLRAKHTHRKYCITKLTGPTFAYFIGFPIFSASDYRLVYQATAPGCQEFWLVRLIRKLKLPPSKVFTFTTSTLPQPHVPSALRRHLA